MYTPKQGCESQFVIKSFGRSVQLLISDDHISVVDTDTGQGGFQNRVEEKLQF